MIFKGVEKAIIFAAQAHEGQRRKAGNTPYIAHPIAVGWILNDQGCDEDVVTAGILHDTVEDSSVEMDDLEKTFGKHIASIVGYVTEPDKSASWEIRKRGLLDSIKTAPVEAKYVYCADKLHNVQSMMEMYQTYGDDLWAMFSRGFEQQKWYAQTAVESLFANLDDRQLKPMFSELEQIVKEFFN
jgi:guanosine-3',5'-bis(diphosphate) 3'-pyrophosphohydrolase